MRREKRTPVVSRPIVCRYSCDIIKHCYASYR